MKINVSLGNFVAVSGPGRWWWG